MEPIENPVRYSIITEKNPREIVMLRGSGCRYMKCKFCDYHLDSSRDEEENFAINKEALAKVTGIYGSLEVINSGSFLELDAATMAEIERVCLVNGINQLRFEVHWMYRNHVEKWRTHFAEKGIILKIKMGVETFDDTFRREVYDKGMEGVTPEEIAEVADEVCLLFGVTGQTVESMERDITTGLSLFERICVNIMVENTTDIHPDEKVIADFVKEIYPKYIDNPRVDILLENTDFGVGGNGEKELEMNEILLILNLLVIYSSVLLAFRLFGKAGLYCFTAIATITANIEVLILVNAFGMEQTLGNILFASSFLVTDILSEVAGKEAQKAVNIGIFTSVLFIAISQSWLLYQPSPNDWAQPSIRAIFSNTPRLMLVSVAVYAICQQFDVWAYHKWWAFSKKHFGGDEKKYLWLRNNGSTMISQLLNTILYTFGAFWGMYEFPVLVSIAMSSYVIFIITSLADTPFVYLARRIAELKKA